MFNKILITNCGDQPRSGPAAKLNCVACVVCKDDCNPMEISHV